MTDLFHAVGVFS